MVTKGFMGHCSFKVRHWRRRKQGRPSDRQCHRFMTCYGDLICITFMHFTHHQLHPSITRQIPPSRPPSSAAIPFNVPRYYGGRATTSEAFSMINWPALTHWSIYPWPLHRMCVGGMVCMCKLTFMGHTWSGEIIITGFLCAGVRIQ